MSTERSKQLREKIESMGGIVGMGSGLPPELEEKFLEHVLACEAEEEGPPLLDHLTAAGVDVPQPDQIDDAALGAKLHEVFEALARLRVYLRSTDHLSDRELYRYLCEEMLVQPTSISSAPDSFWHFDVIGSGSDEDVAIYLRYYADSEERRRWAADFPDLPIPESPPFDRDRRLPRPPWERQTAGK
jgi:hypothetical protein